VRKKLLRIQNQFSCSHEYKCIIANLGGKHILVGASSIQGTMVDSFAFVVFIFFFGGSLHEQ
jgi:hypothetical protein